MARLSLLGTSVFLYQAFCALRVCKPGPLLFQSCVYPAVNSFIPTSGLAVLLTRKSSSPLFLRGLAQN